MSKLKIFEAYYSFLSEELGVRLGITLSNEHIRGLVGEFILSLRLRTQMSLRSSNSKEHSLSLKEW